MVSSKRLAVIAAGLALAGPRYFGYDIDPVGVGR